MSARLLKGLARRAKEAGGMPQVIIHAGGTTFGGRIEHLFEPENTVELLTNAGEMILIEIDKITAIKPNWRTVEKEPKVKDADLQAALTCLTSYLLDHTIEGFEEDELIDEARTIIINRIEGTDGA